MHEPWRYTNELFTENVGKNASWIVALRPLCLFFSLSLMLSCFHLNEELQKMKYTNLTTIFQQQQLHHFFGMIYHMHIVIINVLDQGFLRGFFFLFFFPEKTKYNVNLYLFCFLPN